MDKIKKFFDFIDKEEMAAFATSDGSSVTMRVITPVECDGKILFFTFAQSEKYKQLKVNPNCCIQAGTFFAQATAEFLGATMLDKNKSFRDAYCKRFPQAFDENVEFGGREAEFILLTPTVLSGWDYPQGAEDKSTIPTIPFKISF